MKKTEVVSVRVTDEQKRFLTECANRAGVSLSEFAHCLAVIRLACPWLFWR